MKQRIGAGEFHLPEILCRLNGGVIAEGTGKQCQIGRDKKQGDKPPQQQFQLPVRKDGIYPVAEMLPRKNLPGF